MPISIIYVDMDGVLANFNKRYVEKFNISPDETRDNKSFGGYFEQFINDGEFHNLEMMQDAHVLLSYLDTLPIEKQILSSTAHEDSHERIMLQKLAWLLEKDINYKANFVPGKSHKCKFATPESIIIDDTISIIDDWKKADGIGIHHMDALTTVGALRMYI